MKTLYLETSTEKSCIAISDENKNLSIPLFGGPNLSKQLAMEVSNLLKDNDFRPDQIAVGKGPGSFTGIRVGAALGKALAFAWGIPYLEFCSLSAFFPNVDSPCAVLVDARQGGIYVLIRGESEPELLSPIEVMRKVENIPLILSPHPLLIEKRIPRTVREVGNFLDLKPSLALR